MATRKRTVLRSSKGKKLYAVRRADGTFKDIQSYQRAHAMDMKRTSKAEAAKKTASKKKSAKKQATKKKAPKRKTAKKK